MTVAYYRPIWAARSDGEREIKTKHGREFNGPTELQLNKDASEDEFFELLPVHHEVAQDWKRALGGMLQRQWKEHGKEMETDKDKKWILVDFPENYRLYKHVRKDRNKSEAYFLYGYPIGRKKRYKSAADFFPHLWWLLEGMSDDRTECSCKHCAPDWIQEVKPLPGRDGFTPARREPPIKKESAPVKPQAFVTNPLVVVKQRSTSQDSKPPKPTPKLPPPQAIPKAPIPTSHPAVSRAPAPLPLMPNPLPPPKSREQEQDTHYGRYLYRPGELTWFNRGTAWGLSIIIKRDLFRDQRNQDRPKYLVQPLSHPFNHPETKIVSTENDLRPWLAWSAPNPTHQALGTPNFNYNTVDWKAVLEGRYGSGDAEVDGSIFAAKMIDDSFTLMEPLSNNTTTTGERTYNGIYFGGEKLWVGESIRLRPASGQDIMIIHQIVEKLKLNSTNVASASIHFVGDIYRYNTIPHIPGQEPTENPNLPLRLRQDLQYRNRVTATKRTISYWKIVGAASRIGIEQVKGRWYESSILLPILSPTFQQDIQRGDITDVGAWINGRGDANGTGGKAGTRYKDRLEALGKAVPAETRISRGSDGPAEENAFPDVGGPAQAQAQPQLQVQPGGQNQGQGQASGDGDIAEFMDLDQIEEGFTQGYGVQGAQF